MTTEIINGYKILTLDSGSVIKEIYNEPMLHTISESKAIINASLNQWHDAQIEASIAQYSNGEVNSFPYKREEAKRWELDNTAKTPDIDDMALGGGYNRLELIQSILNKLSALSQLEGRVLRKRDDIKACTTQEQLDAIVW